VALDVRTCLLNLERARRDLALTRDMVQQAEETARVVRLRYGAGSANNLDVLGAELALLRANFAVTNRQIDVQIASADLARAAALDELD
jgi:outer membrane protein TolC